MPKAREKAADKTELVAAFASGGLGVIAGRFAQQKEPLLATWVNKPPKGTPAATWHYPFSLQHPPTTQGADAACKSSTPGTPSPAKPLEAGCIVRGRVTSALARAVVFALDATVEWNGAHNVYYPILYCSNRSSLAVCEDDGSFVACHSSLSLFYFFLSLSLSLSFFLSPISLSTALFRFFPSAPLTI